MDEIEDYLLEETNFADNCNDTFPSTIYDLRYQTQIIR